MATAKDPVCGMDVTIGDKASRASHQGTTYYFCSDGCKRSFEKEPGHYTEVTPGRGSFGSRRSRW
jgi:YHS domain-containing protein